MRVRPVALPLAALLGATLLACASKRPVLYPNDHYRSVGAEVAEQDIDECLALAEAHVGRRGQGGKVAARTAVGGGAGAAVGAAGGAVVGRPGRGAAVGAATGATGGFLRGLFRSRDPDPIYRNFAVVCLGDRGYRPIGWR